MRRRRAKGIRSTCSASYKLAWTQELSRQIVAMLLLKVLLPILLGVHLLAADRSSSRRRKERHAIVIKTVSDTGMEMECTLEDHRVTKATWAKNGREIPSEPERVSIRNGYVRIDPVLPRDEGMYRCNDGREFELTSKY